MTRMKRPGQKRTKQRVAIQKKAEQVKVLAAKIKKAPVVALVSLNQLPDRFLQKARKDLRDSSEFVTAKSTVLERAIDAAGRGTELKPMLNVPSVLVLTSLTPYQLFQSFRKSRGKIAAKPGQLAPFDIIVHEGETDLPPGPALSELKSAGINAQIKAGKIIVAKDSVVAKSGAKIGDNVCKALQKLNILPFETGVSMVAGWQDGLVYLAEVLNIDEAQLRNELAGSIMLSVNMSVEAGIVSPASIDILLQTALSQARNASINGKLYSDATIELLLAESVRLGSSLPEGSA